MDSIESIPNSEVRILVVDDSRLQLHVLRTMLSKHGFQVITAANGQEAIEAARAEKPMVILSDIVMPILDGYAMCKAIKEDDELHSIPVLLLTRLSDPEDIVLGVQAQADAYLTKPFDESYLLATIRTQLGNRRLSKDGEISELELQIEGKTHMVRTHAQQILNLLLSTYGNAVQQNRVLIETQRELRTLNEQLQDQRRRIEEQHELLQQANTQLQELAMSDGLTGLKNRRAFNDKFREEFDRATRYGHPLSLLLLDVDHFKSFNDVFGHLAGDELLKMLAQLLRQQSRDSDFVSRYGGEEFIFLLPDTDAVASQEFAERLRQSVESTDWPCRAITISIGLASLKHEKSGAEPRQYLNELSELTALADQALYRSKAKGRNCVTHSSALQDTSAGEVLEG